jgi:hypothetical protein
MERVVIILIGLEIILSLIFGVGSIVEGVQQARVLSHMDTSAAATATLLKALTDQQQASLDTQNKQLDAAKESESQAGRSANAAERSASVASQAMHVSERAYVGITPSLAKPPGGGRKDFNSWLRSTTQVAPPAIEMISHVTGIGTPSSQSATEAYATHLAKGAFMPQPNKKRISGNNSGMAGVFWVASELSRRNWIALRTVRNQKGVDIIATSTRPRGTKFVEVQVKAIQGRRFWLLGPKERKEIPNRKSLFFVFVRPQSASPLAGFEAFVVPSIKVQREAKQQRNRKFQFCWYPSEKAA